MSTRMLTGLLLIIGPIVMLAGFISIEASGSGPTDWSDTAGSVAALGKNPGLVKTALSIVVLGMLGGAAGLAGLNHSMAGGSGAHYARLGLLLYVIGITIGLAEYTLLIGVAEAAGDGQAGGRGVAAERLPETAAEGIPDIPVDLRFAQHDAQLHRTVRVDRGDPGAVPDEQRPDRPARDVVRRAGRA